MSQALDFLAVHWLAVVSLAVGGVLALLAGGPVGRRWPGWRLPLLVLAGGLACAAVGDLALPVEWAWWALAVAGAFFVAITLALFLTSAWWPPLAYFTGGLGCLAVGALALGPLANGFLDAGESLLTLEFLRPWWLAGLVLLPVLVLLSWPRLNRSEPRPWVSLVLRSLLVLFLVLALAEPRLKQQAKHVTVLFVLDRSQSVPQEFDDSKPPVDLREQRLLKFINEAVEDRGADRSRDQAGLIVFGRRPRLELPPSDAPRFNLREMPGSVDGSNTDISGALKLALASFPEGTAKRIVLMSDGNENLGDVMEVAQLARSLGVQIDVLPLAADQTNLDEVLVERVTAPAVIEQGSRVPITVFVRSFNPNPVVGRLTLKQLTSGDASLPIKAGPGGIGVTVEGTEGLLRGVRVARVEAGSPADKAGIQVSDRIVQIDGEEVDGPEAFNGLLAGKKEGDEVTVEVRGTRATVIADREAQLVQGLNPFKFAPPLTDQQKSYTYEAEFAPQVEIDARGNPVRKGPFPGDRVQNNRASTHVVARGQGRILLLEGQPGTHRELVKDLVGAGAKKFKVIAQPVSLLDNYKERAKLAVFLSNFDCVILANVAADQVSEEQQEVIRSNTHDQGCGLVMIGGPDSFGAGGWQKTAVEKALPVDCDIKSLKVQGKGALVMLMHASEMADGNRWQKVIARMAVERLGPLDEVGILDWGFRGTGWHVPLQPVADNRRKILAAVDKLTPGDMPDFDPSLDMAYKAFMDKDEEYATKHMIIISDGDPIYTPTKLQKFKDKKITITTVGVATHGQNEDQKMAQIAQATGGRYYGPRTRPGTSDPKNLPAIYIKETRLVSQSFVHQQENPFEPIVHFRSGPTQRLPDELPGIRGFVRTTPKPSPLVQIPIETPKFAEQDFPLLAFWHYGLGKAVAFTSDAGRPKFWSRLWAEGEGQGGMFGQFWDQVIEWSLRPTESSRLRMETDFRDGKIRVTVRATTEDGKPDVGLKLRAGLSKPRSEGGGEDQEKRNFVQTNSGVYELEVKAEDAGSYFITAQATRPRKVKGPDGVEREVEEGVDSVRAGVTVPYSPEYAELRSNTPLLERIREMTGGETYVDHEDTLAEAARAGAVFRPAPARVKSWQALWYWLLVLTCALLVVDVAVRRLAFDTDQMQGAWERTWARLRGLPIPEPGQEAVFERLQARRRPEGEGLGARRFEALGGVATLPPGIDVAGPMPADRPAGTGPQAGPSMGPSEPGTADDFQSRLLRAKKKARGETDETE